jgi:hypothetical protein
MAARSTAAWYLVHLLLACALAEFALMRVLLRSGPALEGEERAMHVANLVVLLGHTAMNLGVAAGILTLGALGWLLFTTGTLPHRACALATFALASMLAVVLVPGMLTPAFLAITAGVSAVVVVLAILGTRAAPRRTLALALFGGAYLAIFSHYALQALSGRGMASLPALPAFYLGEVLVVAAAASALLLVRGPWTCSSLIAGSAVGALFLAARMAIPWLVSTIGIWNFGVSMSLPALLYAVALAGYIAALAHLWRSDRAPAIALLLMGLGGMKLDLIYFHVVGLAGLLLLVAWMSGYGNAPTRAARTLPATTVSVGRSSQPVA